MTYCVGLRLDRGLIFMSDTRTNAGVDNVSKVRKMKSWEKPGERLITILSAGNLATTQTVVGLLDERTKAADERKPTLLEAPSMFQVATLVGEALREVIRNGSDTGEAAADSTFSASLIVGGQIAGSEATIFHIYPEGNFIEIGDDNPYFQIGETKYGRPILQRAFDPAMSFEDAVKLLLVSYDSTIRSNIGVDLPIDVQIYQDDGFAAAHQFRIEEDDPYFRSVSSGWSAALKKAFEELPPFSLER